MIWPHEQAAVTADAHDRQIRVTTANVDEAALDLVDLRRAGLTIDAVEVDGQTLAAPPADYAHLRRREHRWSIDGCDARPEFDRTRYEAGGLTTLYQRGSLLIVAPTRYRTVAEQLARRDTLVQNPFVSIPIKRDVDVTDADLADNNLIIIGGPAHNALAARLLDDQPDMPVKNNQLIVGDKRYPLQDHIAAMLRPNPWAPQHRIWWIVSDQPSLFTADNPVLGPFHYLQRQPDLVVVGQSADRVIDARGYDNHWRPEWRNLTP